MKPFAFASRRTRALFATVFALALLQGTAAAQTYPARPVRIVSITSPGTGVDDLTRLLANYLSQKTGQSFFVENKPGANTIIACDYVAKAAPDGYTLLLGASSSMAANPFLFKNLPYSPTRDFAPIARLNALPVAVVVPASSPYRTLDQLMAAARARPGKLNFGTSSAGYRTMLGAINALAKVDTVDVPYKAMSNLLPDLIGGVLDYSIIEVSAAVPFVQADKLRVLAVSSPSRLPALPDAPTLAEAGAGDATLISWVAVFAPAGTPKPVVDKLSKLALEFVDTPEAKAHFAQRGTTPMPGGPAELAAAIVQDQAKWKRYIEVAGIQAE